MTTLLLAEHDNATLSDQTAKAVSAASQLGADVQVLVAGHNCGAVADAAAKLSGVERSRTTPTMASAPRSTFCGSIAARTPVT